MNVEEASKIVNGNVPKGWHIVAVAVPTRALRLIRDDLALRFRIEQLIPDTLKKTYSWRPLQAQAADTAWEAWGPMISKMIQLQARLKEKIKLAQHEARMARIKAENPNG